jgi:hypothetical protein
MFSNNPVSQSMIDAVNKVLGEAPQAAAPAQPVEQPKNPFAPQMLDEEEKLLLEPKSEKVPTPTGMKVYGSRYGNSAKARKDQTSHDIDKLKGPSNKELAKEDKEEGHEDEKEDKKLIKKMVDKSCLKKEDMTFADKLKSSITENKATGTEEIFTDNNLGEEEMSDKQKAKREKIVLSMKDKQADFKQRYGKNWKNVMYATATKQAMAEEVVDESFEDEHGIGKSPKKNQDVADKAYLKHKPGTVKGTLTQLGRFLKGKPEIKEDIEVQVDKSGDTITTDMLSGRVSGGKLNSFRNYKVDLKTSGEEPVPVECDKGVDTKEKQKISTNPGPVDIKLDDKLTTPPQSHFSKDKQIKNEEVRGELKSIRSKQYKMQDKEVTDFRNKHIPGGLVTSNEEVEGLDEWTAKKVAGASYAEKKAKLMAKASSKLPQQDLDEYTDRIDHSKYDNPHIHINIKPKPRKIDIGGGKYQPSKDVREEVEHLNEDETLKAIAKKHDMKYHPGTYGANMSHATKGYVNINRYGEWGHYKQGRFDRGHGLATAHGDSSQHFKDLDKHLSSLKEDIIDEKVIAGTDGWEKSPKNVKDKSGAVHTPMSRAKDLARQSFKKIKSDLGKNK